VSSVRRCDRGANADCAVQVVAVGHGYTSSGALVTSEEHTLQGLKWTTSQGAYGNQKAADSAGHKLRLLYAPANLDLEAIDLGWIQRAPSIAHAMSATMFDRAPAMSLMLETGSS
jgi:hypothetical protein